MNTVFARRAFVAAVLTATLAGIAACTHSMSDPETVRLQSRLDTLEHRRSLIEDANAIKRLQRGYGYYLDVGQWDKAADLFASDGTIEMGLDGVYVGQARVRAYLHALGGNGLTADQINQHMQLMPYVTVAPDGTTAKGTWRDVILEGHLGKNASWGEGPYENEYVKEHGVWKIKSLHWFQTLTVPYKGGWARNEDLNAGKYVSSKLPPDRPPTVQYRTWPGGLLPPFHFDASADSTPSAGAAPTASASSAARRPALPQSPEILARRAGVLTHEVQLLQDQDDIENLQRIYGYYLDKAMWSEAGSLFADDAEYEIEGRGTYVSKAHILDYLHHIGPEFPREGRLYDQMQLQPIVHVAADGRSAKGRWRVFIQAAQAGKFHEWGMGIAENEYVKDGAVWKIRRVHFYPTFFTPFDEGWGKKINTASSFEPTLPPDRPAPAALHHTGAGSESAGAAVSVPAFHYSNPVSGTSDLTNGASAPSANAASRLAPRADTASLTAALDELDRRIGRLEDFAQLENLQMRYGYYLATLEWDRLANLFASDGTIEIALRGVYVGRTNIRRSLNLYGEPGVHEGNLHNHMQYQPVIHVAPDGKTARVRARALSMMGNYGKAGMWMGGIYENQFVKENGVWKFQHDQVFNTYFTPFDVGWKDLQPRPPPGITASNPPDRQPTVQFEMYPRATVWPPFHYDNPVTGKPTPIPREP